MTRTRISLVVMPVMEADRPSIGLTQLQSVLRDRLGDRASVDVLYLAHDFATWMAAGPRPDGVDLHRLLLDNQHTGLPEWFFRQAAFPDLPDNAKAYFRRYYPGRAPAVQALKDALLERRDGLDAFLDGLIDRYRIEASAICGFTSMFVQNVASFALARKLKERRPDLTIVLGGANCEAPMGPEIVRHVDAVDYVFSGPALVSFPEFCGRHLDGERDALDEIPGVFSAARTERPRAEEIGAELELDADVDLDYAAFFESWKRHFPGAASDPMVLFETSRGCWWGERAHCTFCGLNGATMGYRAMSSDRAIGLFRTLFERYRGESSYFFNVDNIMPRTFVAEVLPFIETPPDTTIFYEVKADLAEDELRTMAAAGVTRIQPGIEALATSTLKLMKKGTTVFTNLRLLVSCIRFGITPVWNLLVGFPGESAEVYEKYVRDLPRLAHLMPPQGVAPVRFDRFSPYFMRAEEYGLDLRCFDFYPLIYPFGDAALERMAYYFADQNFDAPYVRAVAQWIGPLRERIAEWRGRWPENGGVAGPPRLALERNGDALEVHDSRSGTQRVHALDDDTARLLAHLERPRTATEVERYGAAQGFDAGRALATLDERELVWEERGRYLSLVVPDGGAEPRSGEDSR